MTEIVHHTSTLIIRNFTNVGAMRTRWHTEACEILASRKDVAEFIKIRGSSDTNSTQTVTILIITCMNTEQLMLVYWISFIKLATVSQSENYIVIG